MLVMGGRRWTVVFVLGFLMMHGEVMGMGRSGGGGGGTSGGVARSNKRQGGGEDALSTKSQIEWDDSLYTNDYVNWDESARDVEKYSHTLFIKDAMKAIAVFSVCMGGLLAFGLLMGFISNHECEVPSIPHGLHVERPLWCSGDSDFLSFDKAHYQPVVMSFVHAKNLDEDDGGSAGTRSIRLSKGIGSVRGKKFKRRSKQRARGGQNDSTLIRVVPFELETRHQDGELGFMFFQGAKLNDNTNAPEGSILVATNCHEFDEKEEVGHEAIWSLQEHIERISMIEEGLLLAKDIKFTLLVPDDGYGWMVRADLDEPDEKLFLRALGDASNDGKFIEWDKGLDDYLMRTLHFHRDLHGESAVKTEESSGVRPSHRKIFNITSSSYHERQSKIYAVLTLCAFLAVAVAPPALFTYGKSDLINTFVPSVPEGKPIVILSDAYKDMVMLVFGIVLLGHMMPRLLEMGAKVKLMWGIYKWIVFAVAVITPIRLLLLGSQLKTYKQIITKAQFAFASTWVNNVLTIMFFAHSVVGFLNTMFSYELPDILAGATADLVLGIMGTMDSVKAMVDLGADSFDVAGTCDLNLLHRLVEEAATAHAVPDTRKFDIRCSETPDCDSIRYDAGINATNASNTSSVALAMDWDKLVPSVWCTGGYETDRKEVSDGTTCLLSCQSYQGSEVAHTLVSCGGHFVLGGAWSFASESKTSEYVCGGRADAGEGGRGLTLSHLQAAYETLPASRAVRGGGEMNRDRNWEEEERRYSELKSKYEALAEKVGKLQDALQQNGGGST